MTGVTLTITPRSPQPANTLITLNASATGGSNVQYQFWVYNPAATPAWSRLQAYSSKDTCAWTPSANGNYLLSVTARDGLTGVEVSQVAWYSITDLTGVVLTMTPGSPQPANTLITLSASATGGTGVQYQFWVYNPLATPAWSRLQAYSSQATCAWTPAATGNYLLSVTARDGGTGVEVSQVAWYMITNLTGVTLTTSQAAPQPAHTLITLNASAIGSTNVQYEFWVCYPAAIPAWSRLQAFSSQSTCAWTPAAPGSYLLSVSARDLVAGNEVNQFVLVFNHQCLSDRGRVHCHSGTFAANQRHHRELRRTLCLFASIL